MRKLIFTMLMAATVLPAAAQAQYRGDDNRDRRDIHQQDRRDVRDDRDHAWARDDWRRWRDHDRTIYARGVWNAPFRYTPFRVGARIAPVYYGPRYFIVDPWRYHLPPAGPGTRWVRHYNDVLLIDVRHGIVLDVIRGFYL
jgi:Ni/Co efflux regulator RcnB